MRPVVALLLVVSAVLAGVATALPIANLDVDTQVGPARFILESEFKEGSVEYTGSAPEYGVNVSGDVVFLEGLGEYQERIGFLKGTAKERTNFIVPYTTDFLGRRAKLNVTVRTDTIPWWVVGVKVPCAVDVELVESVNVSSLSVDRVYFEFRRTVGGEVQKKEVWAKDVSDKLTKVGKHLVYETELEVPEDWGKFDLFGMVDVTMKDVDGVEATRVYRSYSTEPKMITLWTIPVGQGVKIGLTVAAMPASVLGLLLAVLGALFAFLWRRVRLVLSGAAAASLLLGGLFFRIGVSELATLVGYPDDLAFSGGYWLVLAAFVPALVGAVLLGWAGLRWPQENPEEGPDDAEDGDNDKYNEGEVSES